MRIRGFARRYAPALWISATLLLIPGCMQVVRQEAPYFSKGPHQIEPPDGFFEPGTHVWVLGEKDSYKLAISLGGTAAYVWRGDLATLREWSRQQRQTDKNRSD
jgi:hypothetical protein